MLLTRPPLTPKGALDLHVLGLPPAFVLSQDQTLKLKSCFQLILDVRTSAHICSDRQRPERYCLLCFWFQKKPKTFQTVKLTLHDRVAPSSATYVQLFVHRMNQTAHISLQILSISKSVGPKSPETKSTGCAFTFSATRLICPNFSTVCSAGASLRCPVWRSVVRLSAAGEVVFTVWGPDPQALFSGKFIFFIFFLFFQEK